MANGDERLVVLLEARINEFEKRMGQASGTAERSYGRMRRESQSATRQMEQDMLRSTARMNQMLASTSTKIGLYGKSMGGNFFSGLTAGATAALAPILSVAGALAGAKAAMREFDEIGKRARTTGLNPETFQAYAHGAELAGVKTDEFSKALETFAKNAGLASEGKGRMVTALKTLNPELLRSLQLAQSQEERVRILADAIQKETDATKRAAIASAAFGDAGVRMVEMLKDGSAGLDRTAQKARELGIVVDNELIAKAGELADEFDTATKVIDMQFKQALINIAPVLVWVAEKAAHLAGDIRKLVDAFSLLENKSTNALDSRLSDIGRERLDIENQILRLKGGEQPDDGYFGTSFGASTSREKIQELERQNEALAEEERRILAIVEARRKASETSDLPPPGSDIPTLPGRVARDKEAEAAIKQAEAVKNLISNLQAERSEIGLSNAEKRVSQTLRQANVDAASKEGQQIASLIRQIDAETAALEENRKAQEAQKQVINNLFEMGTNALVGIADGSLKAGDAVKKLATELALAAAQAALLGTGPLADLFGGGGGLGSLLGGGVSLPNAGPIPIPRPFARGTDFAPGGLSLVGEQGPELVNLPRGSQVIPNHRLGDVGGGGTQNVHVTVGVSVDQNGNLQAYVANVAQEKGAEATARGIKSFVESRGFVEHVAKAANTANLHTMLR